jgi:hypothetical protein
MTWAVCLFYKERRIQHLFSLVPQRRQPLQQGLVVALPAMCSEDAIQSLKSMKACVMRLLAVTPLLWQVPLGAWPLSGVLRSLGRTMHSKVSSQARVIGFGTKR